MGVRKKSSKKQRGAKEAKEKENSHNNNTNDRKNAASIEDLLQKVIKEGPMSFQITQGREDILKHWKSLSATEKQKILTLEEEAIQACLLKILNSNFPDQELVSDSSQLSISPSTVSKVQAHFLHALETDAEGVMTIDDVTLPTLAIVDVLQARITAPVVTQEIRRNAFLLLMYFLYHEAPYHLLVCFIAWVTVISNIELCVKITSCGCKVTDAMFSTEESSALKAEWQSSVYTAALMLLYISVQRNVEASYFTAILSSILVSIPYGLDLLESFIGNTNDQKALGSIKKAATVLLQVALLYYAVSSYSVFYTSTALVLGLFFPKLTLATVSLAMAATSLAISGIKISAIFLLSKVIDDSKALQQKWKLLWEVVKFTTLLVGIFYYSLYDFAAWKLTIVLLIFVNEYQELALMLVGVIGIIALTGPVAILQTLFEKISKTETN